MQPIARNEAQHRYAGQGLRSDLAKTAPASIGSVSAKAGAQRHSPATASAPKIQNRLFADTPSKTAPRQIVLRPIRIAIRRIRILGTEA